MGDTDGPVLELVGKAETVEDVPVVDVPPTVKQRLLTATAWGIAALCIICPLVILLSITVWIVRVIWR